MRTTRFVIALVVGLIATMFFGTSTLILAYLGEMFPNPLKYAKRMPEAWASSVTKLCNEGIRKQHIIVTSQAYPPPFVGLTILIANHPLLEDIPAFMSVVADLNLHPCFVSKIENLAGVKGAFVGKPLKRIGRGIFISQKGGQASRNILQESVSAIDCVLLFPDRHRPTEASLKKDRKDHPEIELVHFCVPRAGGVYSLHKAAREEGRNVRVIDVSWLTTSNGFTAKWQDVTHNLIISFNGEIQLKTEEQVRLELVRLWKEKDTDQGS